MEIIRNYEGYNPNIDPSISNVFATSALRFGHTLINPVLARLDSNFKTIPEVFFLFINVNIEVI